MKYLVDTTVLVDAARNKPAAIKLLSKLPMITISAVTACELISGARNRSELGRVNKFLGSTQVVEISQEISKLTRELLVRYHLSHGLIILDALIAATALEGKLPLITDNARDFKFIQGLTVSRPSQLLKKT